MVLCPGVLWDVLLGPESLLTLKWTKLFVPRFIIPWKCEKDLELCINVDKSNDLPHGSLTKSASILFSMNIWLNLVTTGEGNFWILAKSYHQWKLTLCDRMLISHRENRLHQKLWHYKDKKRTTHEQWGKTPSYELPLGTNYAFWMHDEHKVQRTEDYRLG